MSVLDSQSFLDKGIEYHRAGRFADALACYRVSLCCDPAGSDACNNAGVALRRVGGFPDSLRLFQRGLVLCPARASLHGNLGNLLRDAGEKEQAAHHLKTAIALEPAYLDAINNLANLQLDMAHGGNAAKLYQIALRLDGGAQPAILGNYLDFLEKANELGKARAIIEGMTADRLTSHPSLALTAAKIRLRSKDAAGALSLLKLADDSAMTAGFRADFWSTVGRAQEALANYPDALDSQSKAKSFLSLEYGRRGIDSGLFVRRLFDERDLIVRNRLEPLLHEQAIASPVFLVGFPRSGTTLIDTILRSHGGFTVLEEFPYLETAIAPFLLSPPACEDEQEPALLAMRERYLAALEPHGEQGKIIVDKLPLNIAHAGMIKILFPEARFVCALRDPRDAVISGYLQSFLPNEGMAPFLTLRGSAEFYDTIFGLWEFYRQTLSIECVYVRYESVVEDFDREIGRLFAYLGVPWRDEVREFYQRGAERGVINTPSYHQVIQPIYRDSISRWKHYAPYLGDAFASLEKWIDAFGYR